MKRLEFHITYICNHKCIFCSEGNRMIKYNNYPLTILQVKTILLDRRKKWFNHVNFTWGEPSLFPDFLWLLKFTKKLWYKIYVWTNWTLLAWEEFCKEAMEYIDELSLSVHWYNQESCYKQIWHKNHFEIFKKVAYNIKKYKKNNFFFNNVVINKHNFKDTLKIIKFLYESDYPMKQVLVSNIAPEWIAENDFKDLVFDLYEFKELIPAIVKYIEEKWIILRFFWIPTCILDNKYSEYANDAHWEERHTIERYTNEAWKITLIDIYSPDNSRKRCFVDKCNGCEWKNKPCTGVFSKYLENYNF